MPLIVVKILSPLSQNGAPRRVPMCQNVITCQSRYPVCYNGIPAIYRCWSCKVEVQQA